LAIFIVSNKTLPQLFLPALIRSRANFWNAAFTESGHCPNV